MLAIDWIDVFPSGGPSRGSGGCSRGLGLGLGRRSRGFRESQGVGSAKVAGMDGIGFGMETVNGAFHAPLSLQTPRIKTLVRLQSKNCSPLRRVAA